MLRRQFLGGAGVAVGATALVGGTKAAAAAGTKAEPIAAADWTAFRDLFPLTRDYVQLSTFLIASHPKPVSDAIAKIRQALDENPSDFLKNAFPARDYGVQAAAARYMGGEQHQYALTDSTTMGLAMVYSGLKLSIGDEILQTEHEHYSSDMSLEFGSRRSGATIRKIALYEEASAFTEEDCVQRLQNAIADKTRVVAVTWVHSSSGVKLPIRAMADVIDAVNANREPDQQIIFCVDGVHGLGIENQDVSKLGCDFFIGGTHKWIFGPRGTGIVWGSDRGWQRCEAIIPSFSASTYVWRGLIAQDQVPVGAHMSPGGFHSFEHRWALPAAFDLHLALGKDNVQRRIHQLNTQSKEGLAKMTHVKLHTPMAAAYSSGFACFEVDGISPPDVVKKMHDKGVIMSNSPYRKSFARFAPSLLNNEQEIDQALAGIAALA
ncbi:MAG: aminotransferase class V-fold PLP-dependent enzyme [Parasphingorhabdus sp.]|uniref:aminotransferase class V-fold PLP-dependent enzyme n=1 Tax=Parasphingorhabdus sp. TaxID=2709688 RepID=UPI0032671A89